MWRNRTGVRLTAQLTEMHPPDALALVCGLDVIRARATRRLADDPQHQAQDDHVDDRAENQDQLGWHGPIVGPQPPGGYGAIVPVGG